MPRRDNRKRVAANWGSPPLARQTELLESLMERIEQAIFTSAQTERAAGYQLAAASPGVCEQDARALSIWGPSHGALLETAPAASVNFNPLPSGAYCVSRTTASGREYTGRGARVYTQCLVVEPDAFRRFGNNPFHLMRAASANGLLRQHSPVPTRLEPVALLGRAPAVDAPLLARATREIGAAPIAALIQAALDRRAMAIAGEAAGPQAVAALFSCLPPACRTEFSFSTGLRSSPRRPFRIVALGTDRAEQRRVRRVREVALVHLSADLADQYPPIGGWPQAILRILKTGRTSLLNRHFLQDRPEPALGDLHARGLQLLAELDGPATGHGPAAAAESRPVPCGRSGAGPGQQPHAAHPRFPRLTQPDNTLDPRLPRRTPSAATDDPAVVERLEQLDDLIFEAVKGNAQSLSRLQQVWPLARSELSDELLCESREQYLRCALSVWDWSVASGGARPSDQTNAALEVICLLLGEDRPR